MGSYDHDDDLDYYQHDNSGMMISMSKSIDYDTDGGNGEEYDYVFPYCHIGETIYWTEQLLRLLNEPLHHSIRSQLSR